MASNIFNYGIRKVILERTHKESVIQLVETNPGMWVILLFKNDELDQSRCYFWFSEKIRKEVQLKAKRDFRKYRDLLLKDTLEWL